MKLADRVTPRVVLVAGWTVFLLYAYPGYLTTASVDVLADANVGAVTDWHSPVMTELWHLVGFVMAGPAPMLFVQSWLFLAGAFVLLRRVLAPRRAAVAACAVLLAPPVLTPMAVIWPEAQLAGFLVAGAAAITATCRWWRYAGLALLVIASAIADGGAAATLPLIVLGFAWRDGLRPLARYTTAAGTAILVVLAAAGLTAALVDTPSQRNEVALAVFDTVGVVRYTPDPGDLARVFPAVPWVNPTHAAAVAAFRHPDRVTYGPDRVLDAPDTPDQREAIQRARRALALEHPGAYLTHRWHYAVRLLGLRRAKGWRPLYAAFVEIPAQRDAIHHRATHSAVQKLLLAIVRPLSRTFLFHPYVYAILALILLPLAIRRREPLAMTLLASALVYEAALAIVTYDPDYQLSTWLVAATVLAVTALVAQGAARRYSRAADAGGSAAPGG